MAQVCHPNALLLNGEVAAVLASMRSSSRWPPASSRYAESELEDPLCEELKSLRRKLFTWQDWSEVEPLAYLAPFLLIIKSPETSGTVTDVALSAVLKVLRAGMLADSAAGVPDALHAVAEAVTQCKFEATYPAFDECVLNRILDVLVAAVRSPQGRLLTHDNLINVFQACYRIGHFQTEKGRETSELLTQASRRAMADLVTAIFAGLGAMRSADDRLEGVSGRATPLGAVRLVVSPPASDAGEEASGSEEKTEEGADAVEKEAATETTALVPPAEAPAAPQENGSTTFAAAAAAEDQEAPPPALAGEPSHHEIVSLLESTAAAPDTAASVLSAGPDALGSGGYGVEALCEVLSFIISFVSAPPSRQHSGLPAHGLDLVLAALHAGGPALEAHAPLLSLLRHELVKALFAAAKNASLACLAGICQVALALYVHLSRHMLLQLEALLSLLLLPLAEGRGPGASPEAQQVALEGVLDFCSQPGFVTDIYLNLDCRLERSDLFEQICTLLSKAAFPVNGPVSSVHVLSLDGIMAILSSLGADCSGLGAGGALDLDAALSLSARSSHGAAEEEDAASALPEEYIDVWTPLSQGLPPAVLPAGEGASAADAARAEKRLKARLASVAEHFNRNPKKAFQLLQSLHLLPPVLDGASVGRFLRVCPGLSKPGIGELLGERDAFYDAVRDAFIESFDFTGLEFTIALRLFMDTFRPPGEGQKIDRIMQIFGKRYYEQMPDAGLKSVDAAYVLAFSVIMLNTDLHNMQNKKKMSLKDFSRINDNTNDGSPMPKDILTRIYAAIAVDELKISSECLPEELAAQSVFWERLSREALRPRGRMLVGAQANAAIERDMFALVWGPTLAAVSVILDGTSDAGVARRAMEGLLVAARLATHHGVPDVADQLLTTLSKYTAVLAAPPPAKPIVAFGESEKGRVAVEATFAIANRYGDALRGGWRHVLECILRLHRIGLLTPGAIAADGEDPDDVRRRLPVPSMSDAKRSSSSLFSRAINSLISIEDGGGAGEPASAREEAAAAAAAAAAEACRVDDLIADSKFLTAESLVELVKATMWAGGNVIAAARTGEGSDAAELALELLITIALRNRDRVGLIWPLVHEYIAACTAAESADHATPLVQRAVEGLFRVCQRLLPYKEDTAETLLASLRLVGGLAPGAAWALAEPVAGDVLALVRASGPYIRTEADWRTIVGLIRMTSARPEAVPAAYEALSLACRSTATLSAESYMPLLETCLQLIDRYKGPHPEAAAKFLDCADSLFSWLPTAAVAGGARGPGALSDEALVDLWLTSVGVMARGLCREDAKQLRDTSIAALHRTLIASAPLSLPPELWVQTTSELLVPLVADLAKMAANPKASKTRPGLEKSVRLAVGMLTKVLLQYVPLMADDRDFYGLWSAALGALQACMAVRQESVMESVPENTKNLLLVLASSGVLTPEWRDAQGRSLWELTWTAAGGISSGLNPGLLSGLAAAEAEQAAAVAAATFAAVSAVQMEEVAVEAAVVAEAEVAAVEGVVAAEAAEAAAVEAVEAPVAVMANGAAPAALVQQQEEHEQEEEEEEAPPACKQS